jgi:hypothetical protein
MLRLPILLIIIQFPLFADDNVLSVAGESILATPGINQDQLDEKVRKEQEKDFWSHFGVALTVNAYFRNQRPLESASISNGVVRVEKYTNVNAGLALETHYPWLCYGGGFNIKKGDKINSLDGIKKTEVGFGIGPYVSVSLGGDSLIKTIGIGLMTSAQRGTNWFNCGGGLAIDPTAKVLASGYEDGSAPPAGATQVETQTRPIFGCQFIVSFSKSF